MPLVVQKFGGSSLADAGRIRHVAARIRDTRAAGHDVVVVVSAMGDTTDELIRLAHSVSARPDEREMDMLLSTGETVSATLVAMALEALSCPVVSLTGAQLGIKTDRAHSRARIIDVETDRVRAELGRGRCVIVTGFQGVTEEGDVTTLGRGGSDTSAVAMACALRAPRCEIYTDVDGVFTADPRVVPDARLLAEITYEEMLELATRGARVMHPRAVELGELYSLPIEVRSSFHDRSGTLIHRGASMEIRKRVRAIAHDTDVAKITIAGVPDRPGIARAIFAPLADAGVNVDVIIQATSQAGFAEISFTVARGDFNRALEITQRVGRELQGQVEGKNGLAKVSIVGTGLQSSPGEAATMFGTLADRGINIDTITTSDIRITCVIDEAAVPGAVQALHSAFELEKE
ncbi:MAG TPA: aspartate kinase [Chloroflexota bacterium]|nr:aspartate kinase [Chloroflexota bacterium]